MRGIISVELQQRNVASHSINGSEMRTIYRLSCIYLLIAFVVEANERDYLKETRDNIQLIEKMVAAFPNLREIDVKAIENQIKPFGQIQTTISRLEEKVELLTKKVNEITQRMNSTSKYRLKNKFCRTLIPFRGSEF